MKLEGLVVGSTDSFHEKLLVTDDQLACVTYLFVPEETDYTSNGVGRETACSELAADAEMEGLYIHAGLGTRYSEERPDSPESRRRKRQPEGRGAGSHILHPLDYIGPLGLRLCPGEATKLSACNHPKSSESMCTASWP